MIRSFYSTNKTLLVVMAEDGAVIFMRVCGHSYMFKLLAELFLWFLPMHSGVSSGI